MDFTRLAKAFGALGVIALIAGVALWQRDNTRDPGYFRCLYSTSYKFEGYVSPYSNPRWNPDNTACSKNETAINPPLLNGIGVGLLLLAFVIGYASVKPAPPTAAPQVSDIGIPRMAPAATEDAFVGQSEDDLLRSLAAAGYSFERKSRVILASNGHGTHHLYSRSDIARLLETEVAKRTGSAQG